MGTEYPSRPNFRPPPFATPRSTTPFSSSGPVPNPPPVPQSAPPPQGGGYNNPPQRPPPPSYGPPPPIGGGGPFQRFPSPSPQMPSMSPVPGSAPPPRTSFAGQPPPPPMIRPPPPPGPGPVSYPSVPMGAPPQRMGPGPGPNLQQPSPAFPGYPNPVTQQAPPRPIGGYAPPPPIGGYAPPPPRPQMVQGGGGYFPSQPIPPPLQGTAPPPMNTIQGLMEDFNSLSLGSVPGSFDSGLDSKNLPRPLEGDVTPNLGGEYEMNCTPRTLRLTTSAIPNSQSLASRWHLPLGAVVCPLAEGEEVPIVNFGPTGIIRCRRCRTYVNPFITFMDSGRKWKCNICSFLNDVPSEYFGHLDANGRRIDLDQRPELKKGTVEFIAPAEYMVRPPMPPLYFFLIDVSISAVKSGMLEVVAETIRSCLDNLPGFPRTQIGFITFDSTIHYYDMKSTLSQPRMMVVSDLDDVFVPIPDDLLVNLSESRDVVDAFLNSLPSMFQDNMNVESAFGPALKAAFMVMSQLGGKMLIFQNTMPSLGPGRLRLRGDDVRIYGTDKEHTLRLPEDSFYKQMAADFTKYQIAVNVYAFSDKYTDIATLGTLAKYTGGQVYYYPSFQATIHKEKLKHELTRDLTRETAWESVLRIRCGKGLRFTSYHGNFMLRSTDLIALPAVDCDKAYGMQLSLEETLLTTPTVYFQVALLYTSSSGERRIRVHTAAAPVVADLNEMYRYADTGAIVSLLSRLAIEKSSSSKLEEARSFIQQKIVKSLREYRNIHAVQHRLGGRMIYPESLKYLPLYGLALWKSTPLRGGYADVQLDERCASGFTVMALPVQKLLKLLYPNLIRIDEYLLKKEESSEIWKRVPLNAGSLDSRGLYIYDDGFRFVLWFGRMVSPDIAMNLLGEDFAADYSKVILSERDNEMSRKLMKLLKMYRENDPSYYQLVHLVRQGEQPREGFFLLSNLVDDQIGGTHGYADWILQIHRLVQQNA